MPWLPPRDSRLLKRRDIGLFSTVIPQPIPHKWNASHTAIRTAPSRISWDQLAHCGMDRFPSQFSSQPFSRMALSAAKLPKTRAVEPRSDLGLVHEAFDIISELKTYYIDDVLLCVGVVNEKNRRFHCSVHLISFVPGLEVIGL